MYIYNVVAISIDCETAEIVVFQAINESIADSIIKLPRKSEIKILNNNTVEIM